MGGVLGYPTSLLVDTWQAKLYEICHIRYWTMNKANRDDSRSQNRNRSGRSCVGGYKKVKQGATVCRILSHLFHVPPRVKAFHSAFLGIAPAAASLFLTVDDGRFNVAAISSMVLPSRSICSTSVISAGISTLLFETVFEFSLGLILCLFFITVLFLLSLKQIALIQICLYAMQNLTFQYGVCGVSFEFTVAIDKK